MISIYKYIEDWLKVDNSTVNKGARKGMLENAKGILKAQEDLHHSGLDRLGRELGRYSKATEEITNGRKKAGELFNLHDTGSLHENMYLEVRESGADDIDFAIGSTDSKESIVERHLGGGNQEKGKRIWGLSDTTIIEESAKDGIIKKLNKIGK